MPVPTVRISVPETPSPGINAMMRGSNAPRAQAPAIAPSQAAPAVAPTAPRPATPDSPALPLGPVLKAPQAGAARSGNQPQPHTITPDGKLVPHNPFEVKTPKAPEPKADVPEGDVEIAFEELDADGEFKTPETPADAESAIPTAKSDAIVESPSETPAPDAPISFAPAQGRDYSIFDPADVEVLKKLPNAAFDRFKSAFVEKAQFKAKADALEQQIKSTPKEPTYLYEHPDSFMLQPEFTQLLQQEDQANQLEAFYADQLVAAQDAQAFRIHTDQGQLVDIPNTTGTVDARHVVYLQRKLNQVASNAQQVKQNLSTYQATYRQKASQVQQQLEAIDRQLFPSWDDNKLTPNEKLAYQRAIEITPEPLRGTHQTKTLARAYVEFGRLATAKQAEINMLTKRIAELEGTTVGGKKAPVPVPGKPVASGDEIIPFNNEDDDE